MSKLTIAQDGFEDTMVLVIGDVHGFHKIYQRFLDFLPSGLRTIQIGDMGLDYSELKVMPEQHKFFRGNHDNPEKCKQHKNYLGDYGYISETKIFYLSGAWSIDRDMRIKGINWWEDEQLSYQELQKAIELYQETKPRFVLSHEAPSKAGKTLLYNLSGPYFMAKMSCTTSRTAEALQQMLEVHQPEEWVFGHYHVSKEFYTPGFNTKFVCVGGMMPSENPPKPKTYVLNIKENK